MADLQWRLNRAGAQPQIRIDGCFGPNTRAALERFQTQHDCGPVDGVSGPKTWAALRRATGA